MLPYEVSFSRIIYIDSLKQAVKNVSKVPRNVSERHGYCCSRLWSHDEKIAKRIYVQYRFSLEESLYRDSPASPPRSSHRNSARLRQL